MATREADAEQRIADLGYLAYVPRMQKRERGKSKHRAYREVWRLLFPCYLFAHLSPELDPWGDIERIGSGGVNIIRSGRAPGPVPPFLVEELQSAESDNHAARWRELARSSSRAICCVSLTGRSAVTSRCS